MIDVEQLIADLEELAELIKQARKDNERRTKNGGAVGEVERSCTSADIDRAAGGYDEPCPHDYFWIDPFGAAACDDCGHKWRASPHDVAEFRARCMPHRASATVS